MPALGIRLQLALGSLTVIALFAANLGVQTWAGAKRDDALARLRHAFDRRVAVAAVQRDLADRWREANVLQHVTLTSDQRDAMVERLRSMRASAEALVQSADGAERPIADAFLHESAPLLLAWIARYGESTPSQRPGNGRTLVDDVRSPVAAAAPLPDPERATERLVALSAWNERVAAVAVEELASVTALTHRISLTTFLVTMVALSAGIVFMWRHLSSGIDQLADGASRLGGGELSHRIALRRNDELGRLALTFNRMAASLEHAEGEAEAARLLAEQASLAKSTFLTSITHDFRTPLTAILGYAELIHDDAVDKGLAGVVADSRHIEAAGRHMLSLVNDLLDIAKADSGRMPLHVDTFDVTGLVDDVVAAIAVLAGQGRNRLEVDVAPDVGQMTSDAIKLRQALFNLVGNAAKFTTDGVITLRAERVALDAGPWLRFVVSDTGIGIPADRIDRVFEAFEQGDSSVSRTYGGSGLGLAITRRFCLLMGGDVTVTSEPGKGTTFVVDLPAVVSGAAEVAGVRLVDPPAEALDGGEWDRQAV